MNWRIHFPLSPRVPIDCQVWGIGTHGSLGISVPCPQPVSLMVRPGGPILEQALNRRSPATAVPREIAGEAWDSLVPPAGQSSRACERWRGRGGGGGGPQCALRKRRLTGVVQSEGDGSRASASQRAHFPPHPSHAFSSRNEKIPQMSTTC